MDCREVDVHEDVQHVRHAKAVGMATFDMPTIDMPMMDVTNRLLVL